MKQINRTQLSIFDSIVIGWNEKDGYEIAAPNKMYKKIIHPVELSEIRMNRVGNFVDIMVTAPISKTTFVLPFILFTSSDTQLTVLENAHIESIKSKTSKT